MNAMASKLEHIGYDELRDLARRRLPKGLFEYIDRGQSSELAIVNNCRAFDRVEFRPRVLSAVSERPGETTLFGETLGMPVAVAPTGVAGIVRYGGELALARAAARAGVPFTVATYCVETVESIAAGASGNLWFQLYFLRDRPATYALVDRVAAVGFKALVVTVDTPVNPVRTYNDRNGFSLPFRYSRRGVVDALRHPRWLAGVMGRYYVRGGGLPRFENLPGSPSLGEMPPAAAARCDDLTWDDIREVRKRWKGPLVLKGLLHPQDALKALDIGADAIVVSNHGGRNLDGTMAPIDALPAMVEAVSGRIEVLVDGGIRRGSDVAKALALGASAVLVGRPALYGLAVAGEEGGYAVLENLKRDFVYVLAALGCADATAVSADILRR